MEKIKIIIKQIEKQKVLMDAEIEGVHKLFFDEKNKEYQDFLSISKQAESSILKYNKSLERTNGSNFEGLVSITRKTVIKIENEYDDIFKEALEYIEKGAKLSRNASTINDYMVVKKTVEAPLNTALFIVDNFDKCYDAKHKFEITKEKNALIKEIKNKFERIINELNIQLEELIKAKKDYFSNLLLNSTANEKFLFIDEKDKCYQRLPFLRMKNDIDEDFAYLEYKGLNANVLYHICDKDYTFLSDLLMQIIDKIPETELNIRLLGNFSVDFTGISIKLSESIKTPNTIQTPVLPNEIDVEVNNVFEEIRNRNSRYLFDGNFFEYNKNNQSNRDKMIIVFVDAISHLQNDTLSKIEQLLDDGQNCGVFFVLVTDDYVAKNNYGDEPIIINGNNHKLNEVFVNKGKTLFNGEVVNLNLKSESFNIKTFIESLKNRKINLNKPILFSDIMSEKQYDNSNYSKIISMPVGKSGSNILNTSFDIGGSGTSFMIVAGMTGSGKSEFLHTMILTSAYIYSPDQLQFYLIDFKDGMEFEPYMKNLQIPHVKLISRRNTLDDAYTILKKIIAILESRDKLMSEHGCKDINEYNTNYPDSSLPRLFIFIDEYQVMLEGNASNSDSRLINKCNTALVDIVKRGRTAGISLILSSQACVAGKDIKEQVAHRVVFKSQGVLDKLFDDIDSNAEEILKGSPKGTAYYTDGTKSVMFRSAYMTKDSESKENSKSYIAQMIRDKYLDDDHPISIIVSNDASVIDFTKNANVGEGIIDLGVSVFDNQHLNLSLKTDEFSNFLIIGEVEKAYQIEASITRSYLFENNSGNVFLFSLGNHGSDNRLKELLPNKYLFSAKIVDFYNKVKILYDDMQTRKKDAQNGLDMSNYEMKFMFINNLDVASIDDYNPQETEEIMVKGNFSYSDDDDDDIFAGRNSSWNNNSSTSKFGDNKPLIDMLRDLYSQSFKYNIFIFIHTNNPKEFNDFFDMSCKGHFEKGLYLNKEAYNYYLDKSSYQTRKVELENQNSIFVSGDDEIKFKRFNF